MITFVHKQIVRFIYAIRGICIGIAADPSFRIQCIGGAAFVAIFSYLLWPLTGTESVALILAWFLVMITELQNSAFESALDRIHPDHHTDIGKSKDMAAGTVLLAGFFALFVVIGITFAHI